MVAQGIKTSKKSGLKRNGSKQHQKRNSPQLNQEYQDPKEQESLAVKDISDSKYNMMY
jgi:hypothetical protein